MVEPDVLDGDVVGVDAEIVADTSLGPDGHVAQPHRPVSLVEQGLGHDPDRVGEVDQPGSRVGAGRHLLGQPEHDRHRAQRLGQAARAHGLLPEAAVPDGQGLVDVPGRLAADAELHDDEVGALERGMGIRCRCERAAPPACTEDALGQPAHDLAAHLARIQQDEIVDDHAVLQIAQTVDQFGGVRAPTADDGHLCPHAAQRNIRPCPTPLPTAPAVLAFDGGSTKTDVVVVSRGAPLLGRVRVGPSNHQLVGLNAMLETLGEAVAAVAAQTGLPAPCPGRPLCGTGVYCLAGIDLPVDEETLAPALAATGWTDVVVLRNDTFAVSRAGHVGPLGHRCGLRHRGELRRRGPRRAHRPLPRAGRALG